MDVRLTTVPGEAEAEALCGLLRSEGIATDGIREILVHEADLDRAREVIGLSEA